MKSPANGLAVVIGRNQDGSTKASPSFGSTATDTAISAGVVERHHMKSFRVFTEPARKGGIAPWAGDFRPAAGSPAIKNPVGKTLTLEMPDGRSGKVVVQRPKAGRRNVVLALLGEDLAPF